MASGIKNQTDVVRLGADLAAAKVELLSAECAADRIRLHYPLNDIVAYGERKTLKRAIASATSLHNFFSQVDAHIRHDETVSEATAE
jgi:hypothetical protein